MESVSTYQAYKLWLQGGLSSCGSPCTILGLAKYGYASRLPAYAIRIPGTVDGLFPIDWPRVPGHEAVGLIDALGAYAQG